MEKTELEEILCFKISRELFDFKNKIKGLELDEILACAYQIDAVINIYEQLRELIPQIDETFLKRLILFPNLLLFLYDNWMEEKDSYNEEMLNYIMGVINKLPELGENERREGAA